MNILTLTESASTCVFDWLLRSLEYILWVAFVMLDLRFKLWLRGCHTRRLIRIVLTLTKVLRIYLKFKFTQVTGTSTTITKGRIVKLLLPILVIAIAWYRIVCHILIHSHIGHAIEWSIGLCLLLLLLDQSLLLENNFLLLLNY